jgi:hypothetical protein
MTTSGVTQPAAIAEMSLLPSLSRGTPPTTRPPLAPDPQQAGGTLTVLPNASSP